MSRYSWLVLPLVLVAALASVVIFRPGSASSAHRERVPVRVGVPAGERVERTDAEWRALLSEKAYHVTRRAGTERAFTGATWENHAAGEYRCVCCEQPLFDSTTKFDSGTGWPSFWQPLDENTVSLFRDGGPFDDRTEVTCSRCDAHLGHVFEDGPKPTGLRYCMNSAALTFVPR